MNTDEIRKWHSVFKRPDELFEIRIVGETRTWSGYFYDVEEAIRQLQPFDNENIYYSVNEVKQACASRAQFNCFKQVKGTATSENDIEHRWWIPIDVDCIRPTGVSSTNEEKDMAHRKAQEVFVFLRNEGFSDPIVCDSSSGYHLLYPIDIDNTPEDKETVKAFLETLSNRFTDGRIKIDTVLCDANRIIRLPGTFGRKGRSSEERPHRLARILSVPSKVVRMKAERIMAFNSRYNLVVEQPQRRHVSNGGEFDIRDFIARNGIGVRNEVPLPGGGTKFVLEECPFDPSHKAPDSAIFEMANGAIAFKCFHNSCSHHDWRSLRLKFDPSAYDGERQWRQYDDPHRTFKRERVEEPVKNQEADGARGSVWQTLSEIDDEDRSKIVSIRSGIAQYDKECCGFDKPSFNVWSGNNGSAKSTLLNQIALNAVNAGFKVAIYSGELRGKRLKRWLVLQAAGKRYNVKSNYNDFDYYTPTQVKDKVVKWLGDKLYCYNTKYSHEIKVVCAEVEKLVTDQGIDMLIADNLSSLDIDELESQITEQQKAAIKMFMRLTERLEIATHLVVHPKKSEGFLRKNDVSGAKTITDLADNVFICHRWNQDTQKAAQEFLSVIDYNRLLNSGATNFVEVIKHREFGQAEGHFYTLYYEPESKRLKNNPLEDLSYGWEEHPVQQDLTLPPNTYEPLSAQREAWDTPIYSRLDTEFHPQTNEEPPF